MGKNLARGVVVGQKQITKAKELVQNMERAQRERVKSLAKRAKAVRSILDSFEGSAVILVDKADQEALHENGIPTYVRRGRLYAMK